MGLKLYVFLQNKYSCWERNVNVHRKCSIWTNHYQINTYLRHKWTVLSVYILQEMKTPFLSWVNNRFVTDACRKSTNEKNISSRMRIANAIFSTYIWRRDFWFRIPSILVLKMRWILFISKKKKQKDRSEKYFPGMSSSGYFSGPWIFCKNKSYLCWDLSGKILP